MPTTTPQERATRLSEILELLASQAPPEDRELLRSFVPLVFREMPDWMAVGISAAELSGRLLDNFRFFVHEIPPPFQLFHGLPGLHVVVRNSQEQEALHVRGGKLLPLETTIVETHTPDAPFIFESLRNYLRRAGLRVFSAIHPILTVRRQWERIVGIGEASAEGDKELMCRFRIQRLDSKERQRKVQHEIFSVLKSVFLAVEDFPEMTGVVRALGPRLRPRFEGGAGVASARAFLDWLLHDNYVFMGSVGYRIGPDGQPDRIPDTASGVFTDPALLPVVFPGLVEEVEGRLLPGDDDARIVHVDYGNNASALHHLEPIDDVVVREWGAGGRLERATLLLGRLSQSGFAQPASAVPLLREKLGWLLENCGAAPKTHVYRQTRGLFNRFPKRELLYADPASLKAVLDQIVALSGDDEMVVQHRLGPGYAALTIAFSRLRYAYRVERDLRRALAEAFGPISFVASHDCGAVHLIVFYFDRARLERPLDDGAARRLTERHLVTWEDAVAATLIATYGEKEGRRLLERHVSDKTRSGLYREVTAPGDVPGDLGHLEVLETQLEVEVVERGPEHATLKLYSVQPLGLTATLTTLGYLGLRVTGELSVPITLPDGRPAYLYRYEIEDTVPRTRALVEGRERLQEALRALEDHRATDGPLGALVVEPGLTWREVEVLRALRNHLLQLRPQYTMETVSQVLLRNRPVAEALFRLFAARFDPALDDDRAERVRQAEASVSAALEAVASLIDDEVLWALADLLGAVLRTNYFQQPPRPVFAMKIDCRKVASMPSPRPMFEIYLHSSRLQGIHLRGGKVARGGIRWSDRHDDFRTEILGLMKTQMVKNSIIVPVGSKGGFVLKGELPPRPALDSYLIERYREFVSGLLDVTDNRVDGQVLHPPEVVRYDDDDPYLVVAADKGTAHLSDTANSVATHYGYWLGDAFASGGSVGYDHKKVGITARGAWECVKHHFRNLGRDIQTEPFTCVGIGDMAGDVFGNGMLLSRVTRLVAAFNHQHVFVDPNPDPERGYAERERLFRLPRSSWRDYDPGAISPGGGVFDRAAKAIPVSPEMAAALGLEAARVSGEELVRRILTAPVDLLYNGGIGTYVKASAESQAEVGDRANDRVRVDARELRARVVGEGGNLGLTQKARLEYWEGGGQCNTDAVDNSGGVDMSDHEVNLKILLDRLLRTGVLQTRAERNRLLAEMTDEVADLVLLDNARQAQALSLDTLRSAARYEERVALVEDMLGAGILNRSDDAVPSRDELLSSPQRERGLPRPLLAVLLGHAKAWAYSLVLETDLPDGALSGPLLRGYFPRRLQQSYAEHLDAHPLRREIVATVAVNHVFNHGGIGILGRLTAGTPAGVGEAFLRCLELDQQGLGELRAALRAEGRAAADELQGLLVLEDRLEELTRAALRGERVDPAAAVRELRQSLRLP